MLPQPCCDDRAVSRSHSDVLTVYAIRTYWWCRPPSTGAETLRPTVCTGHGVIALERCRQDRRIRRWLVEVRRLLPGGATVTTLW